MTRGDDLAYISHTALGFVLLCAEERHVRGVIVGSRLGRETSVVLVQSVLFLFDHTYT